MPGSSMFLQLICNFFEIFASVLVPLLNVFPLMHSSFWPKSMGFNLDILEEMYVL